MTSIQANEEKDPWRTRAEREEHDNQWRGHMQGGGPKSPEEGEKKKKAMIPQCKEKEQALPKRSLGPLRPIYSQPTRRSEGTQKKQTAQHRKSQQTGRSETAQKKRKVQIKENIIIPTKPPPNTKLNTTTEKKPLITQSKAAGIKVF